MVLECTHICIANVYNFLTFLIFSKPQIDLTLLNYGNDRFNARRKHLIVNKYVGILTTPICEMIGCQYSRQKNQIFYKTLEGMVKVYG